MTGRPAGAGVIALLATMDTKAGEAAYVRAELAARGERVRIVDIGLHAAAAQDGGPVTGTDRATDFGDSDVSAAQVAGRAGHDLAGLRGGRRDEAMAAMAAGAARVLAAWCETGGLRGVIGIGGNQGTAVAAGAMRDLPLGLPKLIVSTVASGDVRGFVGDSDVAMMFSVGDLLGGPNAVTGGVLRRAAAAVAAMAESFGAERSAALDPSADSERPAGSAGSAGSAGRPLVAATAFGNTHGAVLTAMRRLAAAGIDVVPFHASGACGSAMERFVDQGLFAGILDLTTHELLGELYPADIYAPVRPGRLTAAGRRGIPQVVVPGGLEYFCFAAPDTIPPELRSRPTHHHNPNNTNVRTSAAELAAVARLMAERLNAARGPVAVLIPLHGWSEVGGPAGVLHDPAANGAFIETLRARLHPRIAFREFETTINDPQFAEDAVRTLRRLLGSGGPGAEPATAAPAAPTTSGIPEGR